MNRLLVITLLAVAATSVLCNVEPEVPAMSKVADLDNYEVDENGISLDNIPESRRSLSVGTVGSGDRLMARITHRVNAAAFVIQDQDVTFRGHEYTNITAVQVTRNGATTSATPSIKAGGLRYNYVTVRIRGVRGQGFDYTINVYASINCSNNNIN